MLRIQVSPRNESVLAMSEPSSKSRHFYLAILLGVTVLIYAQVLRFGLISGWDDKLYFMSHSLLEGWPEASWRDRLLTPELGYPSPLPTAIYFLLHRLPEATAVALAHGVNLIFHLINVCLAFAVARRFLPRLSQAFGATLIWAVHPVLAESVAWITNLKSLGMATAVLAAIWVWDRYLQSRRRDGWWRRRAVWWWAWRLSRRQSSSPRFWSG